MRLVPFYVDLFQVVLDFLFDLILVLHEILQLIVLLDRLLGFQNPQQLVLFFDDVFGLGRFEILVYFPLSKMPSQLLSMLLVLLLVLLYFAVQTQVRVVVLLLVQLLCEERKNVNIRSLLNLHNQIESLLNFESLDLKLDGFHRHQKFPDSVVDGSESDLFSFKGLI